MEAEATTASAGTGGEAAPAGINFDAILDGASPESVLSQGQSESTPAEPTPTPESEPSVEAKPDESIETAEDKPADQTAEEFSEPLPGKLGKLLEAVSKTSPDLARQIRADHEALNGPEGFRGMFRTVEEAREYKTVAPTVEDLKFMSEGNERYQFVDGQYQRDPAGLIRTLAEEPQAFSRVAEAFEPSLRSLNNPQLYEAAARPFNQNFWANVMGTVQREGTPEEVELFRAFEQRYLGQMVAGRQATPSGQPNPAQQELESLRAERESFQTQRQEAFFNEAKSSWTGTVNADLRKHIEEKLATALPKDKDVREADLADAVRESAAAIWKLIDGNPMVKARLAGVIENGDQSPQHKKAVIDAVLAYAKPQIQSATAPVIRRQLARAKAYGGGNGNATTTTTNQASKDVGSGSPTVGTPQGAPKGFPAGWNVMSQEARAKFVNFNAMGDDADYLFISAAQSGDWSKVVLKGK